MKPDHHAFILVGPTAVGKTAAAELLAEKLKLPILSADSMLVYRGMEVGTAKPSRESRTRFGYFGVDLVNPDTAFSVADYLDCARASLAKIDSLIIAGGTGLYVKCLTEPFRDDAAADPAWRAEAERIMSSGGVPALQAEVKKRAPKQYEKLRDPENPRRLIRAVERKGEGSATFLDRPGAPVVGMRMPMPELRARIRVRVENMYQGGLLEEAETLRSRYASWSETARQAIGYAEALTVLAGTCTVEAAKEKTILRTNQLAKRQMTWFRHQMSVDWVDVSSDTSAGAAATEIQKRWEKHGPTALAI